MKPYPKYKDSGVQWIGDIPEHWDIQRLKFLVKLINEKVENVNEYEVQIALENIESFTGRLINGSGTFEGGGNVFYKGDVLFNKLRPYLCKVVQTTNHGVAVGELLVFRPSKHLVSRFLFFRLLSADLISVVNGSTYGAKMPRASWEFIGNLRIPFPSATTQQTIAKHLDRKTQQIDTLIEKKQKQIDLLKEQRTAIINQAITKGLNPKVRMKDSGIEWLGEIPEHWEIKKGKYLFSIVSGYAPQQMIFVDGGEHIYLRVDDLNVEMNGLYIKGGTAKFSLESIPLYQKNLVLFPKRGAAIFTNKVRITAIPCLFDTNIMGLNVYQNKADKEFVSYCLLARRLDDIADTSTVPQINNKHIYPLPFPHPPIAEQESISNFIHQYTKNIDTVMSGIEETMRLLKEYRTALISEIVSGKIDVRNEVLP